MSQPSSSQKDKGSRSGSLYVPPTYHRSSRRRKNKGNSKQRQVATRDKSKGSSQQKHQNQKQTERKKRRSIRPPPSYKSTVEKQNNKQKKQMHQPIEPQQAQEQTNPPDPQPAEQKVEPKPHQIPPQPHSEPNDTQSHAQKEEVDDAEGEVNDHVNDNDRQSQDQKEVMHDDNGNNSPDKPYMRNRRDKYTDYNVHASNYDLNSDCEPGDVPQHDTAWAELPMRIRLGNEPSLDNAGIEDLKSKYRSLVITTAQEAETKATAKLNRMMDERRQMERTVHDLSDQVARERRSELELEAIARNAMANYDAAKSARKVTSQQLNDNRQRVRSLMEDQSRIRRTQSQSNVRQGELLYLIDSLDAHSEIFHHIRRWDTWHKTDRQNRNRYYEYLSENSLVFTGNDQNKTGKIVHFHGRKNGWGFVAEKTEGMLFQFAVMDLNWNDVDREEATQQADPRAEKCTKCGAQMWWELAKWGSQDVSFHLKWESRNNRPSRWKAKGLSGLYRPIRVWKACEYCDHGWYQKSYNEGGDYGARGGDNGNRGGSYYGGGHDGRGGSYGQDNGGREGFSMSWSSFSHGNKY
eukprot:180158_1